MSDAGIRAGIGFDIHRMAQGRPLVLGGVRIPNERGLEGHSDADALLHAICDAMLGALALGDIGRHFPDTDPRYRGISSLELLTSVAGLVRSRGYKVESLDATIIAEAPKLSPHIERMRTNIAGALEISSDTVSVKAKTHEGLGPIGHGEAIAAQAICLVSPLATGI